MMLTFKPQASDKYVVFISMLLAKQISASFVFMKVVIASADLEFLNGGSLVASRFPIRIMRAAFQRTDLLRAVPRYEHISRWKALRYQPAGANTGSITVIDTWRMDVRGATGNEDPSQIAILRIRNAKND